MAQDQIRTTTEEENCFKKMWDSNNIYPASIFQVPGESTTQSSRIFGTLLLFLVELDLRPPEPEAASSAAAASLALLLLVCFSDRDIGLLRDFIGFLETATPSKGEDARRVRAPPTPVLEQEDKGVWRLLGNDEEGPESDDVVTVVELEGSCAC